MKQLRRSVPARFITAGVLVLLFPLFQTAAQTAVGEWRDHLPYNEGRCLALAGTKVYCSTSGGGLFSLDTRDNSLTKLSKVTGLSDADISSIGYSEATRTLVIAYSNGNLDLVRNDSIFNLPDIRRKAIMADKAVNRMFFMDRFAYLACGFGIVVCDLQKMEISDSYLFGPGGTQIRVNDIVSDGNYLFAATEFGIYKASMSGENLVDYNAWQKLEMLPEPDAEYRFLAWHSGKLFTVYHPETGSESVISVTGTGWEVWPTEADGNFGYLGALHGNLLVCSDQHIRIFDQNGTLVRDAGGYYPKFALTDAEDRLWYADPYSGLVGINPNGSGTIYCPVGPAYRSAGDMQVKNGTLWVGGGTEGTKWKSYGAYSFSDEKWTNYNNRTFPLLEGFLNISRIAIDPADPQHVFGGSIGYGVVEFKNGALTGLYDETNSVLRSVTGYGHGFVIVSGMCLDAMSNLFVSTTFSENPVYRRKASGEWEVLDLAYPNFGVDTRIGEVLATSEGQVWLLVQNDGIVVFDADRDNSSRERFFSVRNQIPDLLDRVYSIAEDRDGNIWVGTNKGPVVYYNPGDVFDASNVQGYQPEIPRNDGTNYVDLLLSTEKINDIAVDGANRKWFATEKSGVFLVSDDGKKEIRHFTAENSPLFSNNVLTLAVNDLTGEVFFGTDKGMVSWRGEATEATDEFGKVYVFPNPVREDFDGMITVTGLARDSNVKITDISGNLVYETTALGGQAVWDGRNFRGERVYTGVYLVFCTNRDGSRTHVTKLLFIH
jgi:hypothetical protein